jgi:hypothetical protein
VARKAMIALVAGLALAVSWASPALAEESSPAAQPNAQVVKRPIQASLSAKSRNEMKQLELKNLKTGATIRPFATSLAAGPCDAPVSFSGEASYLNGVLSSVTLDYQAQVLCPVGLNMGAILVTAQLWKDVTMLDEGPTVNCVDCLASPLSIDFYACGGVGCAGSYWAANLHALRAPEGYVWTGAPPGCIGGQATPPFEWIQCSNVTDIAVVTPNI